MPDTARDLIKDRLDHADVRIVHLAPLETGGWRVKIEYAHSRVELKRFVEDEFTVQAAMPSQEGGVYAMLGPNLQDW